MNRPMKTFAVLALVALATSVGARAQEEAPSPSSHSSSNSNAENVIRTYHLRNIQGGASANEILVALRNMIDPSTRIYLVAAQNDIVVFGSDNQQKAAQRLIDELDKPTRSYRLTFTITAVDGGKTVGVEHYTMIVLAGQRTVMKIGNKVPLLTSSGNTPQFTFVDVGMNFDVTADPTSNGILLKSKVEQSSATQQEAVNQMHEPIIGQAILEGSSIVADRKPLMLGSLDVPNSTQHYDISVMEEPLP